MSADMEHSSEVVLTEISSHRTVTIINLDPDQSFGLTLAGKNKVHQVRDHGLGAAARIKAGDELLTVNGAEINGQDMLFKHLRMADPVTELTIASKTAEPPEYILVAKDGKVLRQSSPFPEWIFAKSYKELVAAWKKEDVVSMLDANADFSCGEVGAAVRDVTPALHLGLSDPKTSIYRELFEWCASQRARIEKQQSWPLLTIGFTVTNAGDSTGCALSPVCEMDLALLPEDGDGQEAFERLGWQLQERVELVRDVNHNTTHTRTIYTLYEPLGLRTGRAPFVENKGASGLLAPKLKVGDVIVAVDGVLITRGKFQIIAMLDSFEKGRDFTVAVRRRGATADGTVLESFSRSDKDPPPIHGGGEGGSACCLIL